MTAAHMLIPVGVSSLVISEVNGIGINSTETGEKFLIPKGWKNFTQTDFGHLLAEVTSQSTQDGIGMRANRFIGALLNVIQSAQRIFPVSCAVLMEEWHKLSRDERAYLTGGAHDQEGKIVTSGAPNKPYFLPFLTAITTALEYCDSGLVMHFSFDHSRHFSGYAERYFKEIQTWNLAKFERMGEISFVDSKKATPIQAADLLAFETYRYGLARLKVNLQVVNPRSVLHAAIRNIKNLRNDSKMFDKHGFDLVLKQFRSMRD